MQFGLEFVNQFAMHKVSYFLVLIFLISCTQSSKSDKQGVFYSHVEALKTDKEKNDFLYNLWHEDQNLRIEGEEGDVINKHGYHSKQHKQLISKIAKSDNDVFLKMKTYLEIHGYPINKSEYHELAINAFPIIVGHNHNFASQLELLPYFFNAYKENHCALGDVVWVVGEMYESKNGGRRYNMKSNKFTTEQEFEELVETLGLDLKLKNWKGL